MHLLNKYCICQVSAMSLALWVWALGVVENSHVRSELMWILLSKGEVPDNKQVRQLNKIDFMVDSPLVGGEAPF